MVGDELMGPFNEEELKIAFWKTFYREGEVFFDYMGTLDDEECECTILDYWQDFLNHLKERV